MTERVSDARLRVIEEMMGATDGDPELMPSQEEVYQMVAELLVLRARRDNEPWIHPELAACSAGYAQGYEQAIADQRTAGQVRPGSEYHEDMGPVLWLERVEGGPPNVHAGTPTDSDWPFLDYSVVVFVPLPHDAVKAADERERAIRADVPAW